MNNHSDRTNHLDLWQLWLALKDRKTLVFIVTVLFFFAALGYTKVMVPIYRADVLLLPSDEKELKAITLAYVGIGRSDTPEIYDRLRFSDIFFSFKQNLASRTHQREFLTEYLTSEGITNDDIHFKQSLADGYGKKLRDGEFTFLTLKWWLQPATPSGWFRKILPNADILKIAVNQDRTTSSRRDLILSVYWQNRNEITQLANAFTLFVMNKTNHQVVDLLNAGISIRRDNLVDYIEHQRLVASEKIKAKINHLQNAIKVSKALNLSRPTDIFGGHTIVHITPPPKFFQIPDTKISSYDPQKAPPRLPLYSPYSISPTNSAAESYAPPLYARGWIALEKELELARDKTLLDSYVPNIHELLASKTWIDSIDVSANDVKSAVVSQPAIFPTRVTPDAPTIVAIATLIGFLIAIFLALSAHVLSTRRI